jgi:hypothetical protein
VAAFRMFGRPAGVPREIVPGSATSHARLSRRAEDLLGPARRDWDDRTDTPTDPHGFPPITTDPATVNGHHGWPDSGSPAVAAAWSVAQVDRLPTAAAPPDVTDRHEPGAVPHRWEPAHLDRPTGTHVVAQHTDTEDPVPHPAEAAALAGAFAADYLSWDEDDPDRRARVLGDYLADRRPARLGWSGHGRQRADFALPGLVRPDGEGRVLVDVRVRVTPYRRVPGRTSPADDLDDGPAVPAAAPAPAARGWRGLPGRWVRVGVAVRVEGDRLVVDAEEELDDPADEAPTWPSPAADTTHLDSADLHSADLHSADLHSADLHRPPATDLDDDAPLEMR